MSILHKIKEFFCSKGRSLEDLDKEFRFYVGDVVARRIARKLGSEVKYVVIKDYGYRHSPCYSGCTHNPAWGYWVEDIDGNTHFFAPEELVKI